MNERKIIQIATFGKVSDQGRVDCVPVVLCDDGSLWEYYTPSHAWIAYPKIPSGPIAGFMTHDGVEQ